MPIRALTLPLDAAPGAASPRQDELYERIATEFAAPLARLARAHEADRSLAQDLLQEIHIALWRSLGAFGGRCSLRTWVYRVAHNVAATHVLRSRRRQSHRLTTLDDVDIAIEGPGVDVVVDAGLAMQRIHRLIQSLKPLDRQVIILHLEGLPDVEIADIAGLSMVNTRTKLTRIRQLLAEKFKAGVDA